MLDMILGELESFYPEDEIIKDYGEALMKYKSEGFIYPYTNDEEKEMIHNTEKQLAYDEGVEQTKIDVIKNMLTAGSKIENIAIALGISVDEIEKIINENNLDN